MDKTEIVLLDSVNFITPLVVSLPLVFWIRLCPEVMNFKYKIGKKTKCGPLDLNVFFA